MRDGDAQVLTDRLYVEGLFVGTRHGDVPRAGSVLHSGALPRGRGRSQESHTYPSATPRIERCTQAVGAGRPAGHGAAVVVFVSSGGRGSASAETSLQDYLAIQRVAANVVVPKPERRASRGVFRMDCGTNQVGKFSPDNPVAQPGIKNGAEHVHDFVGNLAITADTSDAALATSETTCPNGDCSAYSDRSYGSTRVSAPQAGDTDALAGAVPMVTCPSVGDRLPAIHGSVAGLVKRPLARLDQLTADADTRLATGRGSIDGRLIHDCRHGRSSDCPHCAAPLPSR